MSFLTVKEAASVLGLCQEQVRRKVRSGELSARKAGRNLYVDQKAVSEYVFGRTLNYIRNLDPVLFEKLKEVVSEHFGNGV